MTTDRLNSPSPDAAPVQIPGWCHNPASTPPIHRRADSCTLVECPELVLPAGLVAELRGEWVESGWICDLCGCWNPFAGRCKFYDEAHERYDQEDE